MSHSSFGCTVLMHQAGCRTSQASLWSIPINQELFKLNSFISLWYSPNFFRFFIVSRAHIFLWLRVYRSVVGEKGIPITIYLLQCCHHSLIYYINQLAWMFILSEQRAQWVRKTHCEVLPWEHLGSKIKILSEFTDGHVVIVWKMSL